MLDAILSRSLSTVEQRWRQVQQELEESVAQLQEKEVDLMMLRAQNEQLQTEVS